MREGDQKTRKLRRCHLWMVPKYSCVLVVHYVWEAANSFIKEYITSLAYPPLQLVSRQAKGPYINDIILRRKEGALGIIKTVI